MTEQVHAIDQMGMRPALKQTPYGKKRTSFEDLTGVTLPNGWRVTEYRFAYSGASNWAFECSKDCGAHGVGSAHAIKIRKPCKCDRLEEAKADSERREPLIAADYMSEAELKIPTPRSIIEATCAVYGIRFAQLSGASKNRTISEARWVAQYLMRHLLHMSYPEIGKLFLKDHSSVFHAVKTLVRHADANPIIHARMGAVAERLSRKLSCEST